MLRLTFGQVDFLVSWLFGGWPFLLVSFKKHVFNFQNVKEHSILGAIWTSASQLFIAAKRNYLAPCAGHFLSRTISRGILTQSTKNLNLSHAKLALKCSVRTTTYVTKLFFFTNFRYKMEVVPGKLFQPSLMFVGKARSLPLSSMRDCFWGYSWPPLLNGMRFLRNFITAQYCPVLILLLLNIVLL
jgi:hypothetical protein